MILSTFIVNGQEGEVALVMLTLVLDTGWASSVSEHDDSNT